MRSPLIATLTTRSFLFLLISEFFSQFAMNLLNFILLIVAFSLSKSNLAVAGVILSFTIPSILFGLLAGAYVDKWNKKKVLAYSNILRALAVFPLVFVSHELALIYVFSFMVSFVTQFFLPAETPIIPLLVKKDLLLSANALFSMGIFGSIIIAYALSGPILLLLGRINSFILITVLFFISGVFAFMIKLDRKDVKKEKIDVIEEIRVILGVVKKNKNIYHSIFLLTLLQTLILVIAAIGPGYATDILHIQVEKFPILFVTPAVIGMSIGAVIIGNFLHKKSKQMLAKIGLLVIGIIVLFFPYGNLIASRQTVQVLNNFLPNLLNINLIHIMVASAVVIGFSFSMVFVPSNTILQEETTDEQRGKMYGLMNTLVGAVSIVPILGAGFLSDLIGVGRVITFVGISIIVIALLRFFKFR